MSSSKIALPALPIDEWIPKILESFQSHKNLILVAPPGAGKTTRVPVAFLDSPLLLENQEILVLQPRRMAARATAHRMAYERNCSLGEEIGYQIRFENRSSTKTRLRVVTEGILERRLLSDPELKGVGLVILDEFHERSIHSDLCVALLREVQESYRPDLKILAMSATLEAKPLQKFLNDCPLIESSGRLFPIDISYQATGLKPSSKAREVAELCCKALGDWLLQAQPPDGDILVFLPGIGEINRCLDLFAPQAKRLNLDLFALHSGLSSEEQDRVLESSAHRKKRIIFSTNIAETSLTIEGVTLVVDSGLVKQARCDAQFGIEKLEQVRISKKNAEQRAGRAGRVRAGRCLRLWSRDEHLHFDESVEPEISRIDLSPTLLLVADWGVTDFNQFSWFEAPPKIKLALATNTLKKLGALNTAGHITDLGKRCLSWPLNPRVAVFLESALAADCGRDAYLLAAILSERSLFSNDTDRSRFNSEHEGSDLVLSLNLLNKQSEMDNASARSILRIAKHLQTIRAAARASTTTSSDFHALNKALLRAFSDRLCRRRAKTLEAKMVGGRGIVLSNDSVCKDSEYFLAIDPFEFRENNRLIAKLNTAHPVTLIEIQELFPERISKKRSLVWNENLGRAQAFETLCYEDLELSEPQPVALDPAEIQELQKSRLLDSSPESLAQFLSKNPRFDRFLKRLKFLTHHCSRFKPTLLETGSVTGDINDDDIKKSLGIIAEGGLNLFEPEDNWLPSIEQLWIGHASLDFFRTQAPHQIQVPSGSVYPIEYSSNVSDPPTLAVRLQEVFGWPASPRLAEGKIPIRLELLSPGYKPVQVTNDLSSFWSKTYFEVRKELKARYPRHSWPENPLVAVAVSKGGKKFGSDY